MADKTGIEWADATWNPIVGCSIVSPGCTNCYAMSMARRIEAMMASTHYAATTQVVNGHAVWTGKVTLAPEHILTQPLRWRRPRKIFANSMGDIFHESAPDEWIDRVFVVMALCPQHTFQVLTKRSARMRAYLTELDEEPAQQTARRVAAVWPERVPVPSAGIAFPLPNVWLGVSAEDQRRADERRDDLAVLAAAGWRTFVSYEPALGSVDWTGWEFLSWLISGGESGPNARPSHPDWHRTARDFSAAHDIPYFFKQWGEWLDERIATSSGMAPGPDMFDRYGSPKGQRWHPYDASDRNGGSMIRVGKRAAGRLLDGVEHNGMPEARS